MLAKYDFEIKYCSNKINFANKFSKQFDYKEEIDDKLYLSTLQNKLKNIIIVIINLISIIIRDVVRTQKIYLKSVLNISRIKKIDKDNFDKFSNNRSNNLSQVAIT